MVDTQIVTKDRCFFHGGCRGLQPGDMLLPAAATGVDSVSGAAGAPYSRDHIYLTLSVEDARSYAAVFIPAGILERLQRGETIARSDLGGDVYEVEPLDEVGPDLDHPIPGVSWQTKRARVVRIVERGVAPDV